MFSAHLPLHTTACKRGGSTGIRWSQFLKRLKMIVPTYVWLERKTLTINMATSKMQHTVLSGKWTLLYQSSVLSWQNISHRFVQISFHWLYTRVICPFIVSSCMTKDMINFVFVASSVLFKHKFTYQIETQFNIKKSCNTLTDWSAHPWCLVDVWHFIFIVTE